MQKLEPSQVKDILESKKDVLLVDIREPLLFADGFIPGSINISPENYKNYIPALISKKVDIILIADSIPNKKFQSGKFPAQYYMEFLPWKEEEGIIDMIITIDAYEFGLDLKFDKSIFIIDLRIEEDFNMAHVEDIINIPFNEIVSSYPNFELENQIYFYGYKLDEAMTAASLFKKQGYNFVKPIEGGFEAISNEENIKLMKKKKKS